MTATALLEDLDTQGVRVTIEGDSLKLRGAEAVLTPDLLAKVRECKPELMEALRSRPTVAGALPGKVEPTHWPVTDAELLALPLDDFARAGLVVRVWSSALGERVIFASDNARIDPGEGLPVYRAAELRELLALGTVDLRKIHEVKSTFGGSVAAS